MPLPSLNHSRCCPHVINHSVAPGQPIALFPPRNHSCCCPSATIRVVALAQSIALLPSRNDSHCCPHNIFLSTVPSSYYYQSRENLTPIVLPSLGDNTREKRYCPVQSIVPFSRASCCAIPSLNSLSPRAAQFSRTSCCAILSRNSLAPRAAQFSLAILSYLVLRDSLAPRAAQLSHTSCCAILSRNSLAPRAAQFSRASCCAILSRNSLAPHAVQFPRSSRRVILGAQMPRAFAHSALKCPVPSLGAQANSPHGTRRTNSSIVSSLDMQMHNVSCPHTTLIKRLACSLTRSTNL